jgi:hypothetical protein
MKRTIAKAAAQMVVQFPQGTREERETQGIKAQRKTIDKQFKKIQKQTDKLIEELFK